MHLHDGSSVHASGGLAFLNYESTTSVDEMHSERTAGGARKCATSTCQVALRHRVG